MSELEKYDNDFFSHARYIARKNYVNAIPLYGGLINDIIDFTSELRAKRVIKFIDVFLQKAKEEFGEDFSMEALKNESFSDLFTKVLNKVQNTSSEYKKNRFKDILLLKLKTKSEDLLFEKFVNLLDQINDIQIIMLKELSENNDYLSGITTNNAFLLLHSYRKKLPENDNSSMVTQDNDELEFYMLDLVSMGLIKGLPPRGSFDSASQSVKYSITAIGKRFIQFIIHD